MTARLQLPVKKQENTTIGSRCANRYATQCKKQLLLTFCRLLSELLNVILVLISVTPRRRWGTLIDAAMTAHRSLSSAMRSNTTSTGLSIPWYYSSVIPSSATTYIYCSMKYEFWQASWRQTWPNHDNLRRLTVGSETPWRTARILTCCHTYSSDFWSLCDMPSILLWHLFSDNEIECKISRANIHDWRTCEISMFTP